MVWAIVPAAGRGSRLPGDRPKQYRTLAGRTVLDHCLARLLEAPGLQGIMVALSEDDAFWPQSDWAAHTQVHRCIGGQERADSVLAAMRALQALDGGPAPDGAVLVHDAARALLPRDALRRLLAQPPGPDGAILALPAQDSLKHSADGQRIQRSLDRSQVWLAQTPQYFEFDALFQALEQALAQAPQSITDEASALERQGRQPRLVPGDARNFKITTPADWALAELLAEKLACE